MVTQKPISVRIDLGVLDALDKEVATTGIPRNMLINRAAKDYLELLDIIRQARTMRMTPAAMTDLHEWIKNVENKKNVTWRI